jgi:SAM-dependent methyltransferase
MEGSGATAMKQLRFYQDLARYWPLISPVEEYAGEAEEFRRLLKSAPTRVETVLELGSGGGHNAYYLKRDFEMTLSDLSEEMLAVSRGINPECEHIHGDMRTLALGRTFDAVFIHDAIHYMTTEGDLAAALANAHLHCRPGGVALVVPDELMESFEPGTDSGGTDGVDGQAVRFLEWSHDPDPTDTWGVTHYSFIVREANGEVSNVTESHRFGLFSRATWMRLLEAQGFVAEALVERTDEDRPPRLIFRCLRPNSQ